MIAFITLSLFFAACGRSLTGNPQTSGTQATQDQSRPPAGVTTTGQPTAAPSGAILEEVPNGSAWPDGRSQTSDLGMVTVVVTPLNLNGPDGTLKFDVTMDTHSVELNMDLATLATLTTDNGLSVSPAAWDAATGSGHHVSGILSFPAAIDGQPLLGGATELTLAMRGVDAPERIFTWSSAR